MKIKWNVTAQDGEHTVEFNQSFFGVVRVSVDGQSYKLGFVSVFSRRCEPFRVGDEQCMLTIKRGGSAEVTSASCVVERINLTT